MAVRMVSWWVGGMCWCDLRGGWMDGGYTSWGWGWEKRKKTTNYRNLFQLVSGDGLWLWCLWLVCVCVGVVVSVGAIQCRSRGFEPSSWFCDMGFVCWTFHLGAFCPSSSVGADNRLRIAGVVFVLFVLILVHLLLSGWGSWCCNDVRRP